MRVCSASVLTPEVTVPFQPCARPYSSNGLIHAATGLPSNIATPARPPPPRAAAALVGLVVPPTIRDVSDVFEKSASFGGVVDSTPVLNNGELVPCFASKPARTNRLRAWSKPA